MDIQKIKVISVRPPQLNNHNPDAWGFYTHLGWGKNCGGVDKHVEHTRRKIIKGNK